LIKTDFTGTRLSRRNIYQFRRYRVKQFKEKIIKINYSVGLFLSESLFLMSERPYLFTEDIL